LSEECFWYGGDMSIRWGCHDEGPLVSIQQVD